MTTIPDPLPLYHGTIDNAAKVVRAKGFTAPDVAKRLRALAKRSLSRNFCSMMAPLRTLRSLVRKKVSPRAFWPC